MWQFLSAGTLGWLALLLPAIAIMYFLKLRRQEQPISSVLLWRRSVHDLRVNSPFRWLRRNLLLLLQLLIATFIILALARPYTQLTRAAGRRAALILDCSASMATRDGEGGRTRFAAAREEAYRLIDVLGVKGAGASRADELCLIAAAERPVLLCGLTSDKARLRQAAAAARIRETGTDLAAALEMAVAVTGAVGGAAAREPGADSDLPRPGRPLANVIVLSDGAYPPLPARLAAQLSGEAADEAVGAGSRFISFGREDTENLGIVTLDLQASPDLLAGAEREEKRLFVRVENSGRTVRKSRLTLQLDGKFVDARELELPAATNRAAEGGAGERTEIPGQAGAIFTLPGAATGVAELFLEGDSAFTVDDRAWAVLEAPKPIRALLVSEGNFFLERALAADRGGIVFDTLKPAALPGRETAAAGLADAGGNPYEIVIYDRCAPAEADAGAALYIDALPPLPGITAEEPPLYAPRVIDWNRLHPLTRNLTLLEELRIRQCRRLKLESGWTPVITGEGLNLKNAAELADAAKVAAAPLSEAPLLACRLGREQRAAVLAFDIFQTERWPLRVSFPLFVRNAVHWLARPGGLFGRVAWPTGEALRADFTRPISGVQVRTPDGTTEPAARAGARGAYFAETGRRGVYRLTTGDEERRFACDLLSSAESAVAARPALTLGDLALTSQRPSGRSQTELWPWLALAALAFLVVEWYVYHRRVLG